MAEYVGLRTEEIVPLTEELQRSAILNSKEIRILVSDISNFEYKIERRERNISDTLEYIGYQRRLLKKIKHRRKEMNFSHKTEEIEGKIIARIHSQFGSAKRAFGHDLQLWKANVEFLQDMKSWSAISALYQELLCLHGSKYPHLYKNASSYEFSVNPSKGIEAARLCYKKGFRMHPKNMDLKLDAFSLELKYIDYLYKNKDAMDMALAENNGEEIVTELKLVKVLYEQATKSEPQSSVFLDFVLATMPYEFATTFREEIIRDIKEMCGTNESTYDNLAKLAIRSNDIERGIQQYHIGLKLKPTETMYDYFLESLWILISKVSNDYIKIALPIFEQAHANGKLSEKGFLLWSHVLGKGNSSTDIKNAKSVLKLGIQTFNSNPRREAWILNIEMVKLKLKEDFDPLELQDMIHCIDHSKIPEEIWTQSFLAFALRGLKNSNLDAFVETVKSFEIKAHLRTLLLTHIGYHKGREKAREYYETRNQLSTQSFRFHQTMIKLELCKMDESTIDFVRQCYTYAINQFGSSLPEVWVNVIEFERVIALNPQQASYYHAVALKNLGTDKLREDFNRAIMQK